MKFYLFADDTNISFSSKDLDVIQKTINDELKYVSEWLVANRLALNTEKTNYIVFHSPKHRPYKQIIIHFDNEIIHNKNYIRYLGILIDSNLSWQSHILELSKKIAKSVGILSETLCTH